MNGFLINQIVVPLAHRAGTLAAGWLATQGVTATDVATVEGAITILIGLGADFIIRKVI